MMVATYRLNTNEITDTFLKSIQANYQNKEIEITIQEVEDETDYLLKSEENRKLLLAGVEAVKQGRVSHTMALEEIEAIGK